MNLPHWPGWHLIGAYPDHDPDDVGSWILHHQGEALLLEVPEGLPIADVQAALESLGSPALRYVTASHDHEDHLDTDVWAALERTFPHAQRLHPASVRGDKLLQELGRCGIESDQPRRYGLVLKSRDHSSLPRRTANGSGYTATQQNTSPRGWLVRMGRECD